MPLLDHFHPPLSVSRPWEGFHSAWASMIAQQLNRTLPPEFVALPQVSRGPSVEIDVAALELTSTRRETSPEPAWEPEAPGWSCSVDWSERDLFEVRVIDQRNSPRLAAAIELITPANKDRPATRQAFAGKCAGLLRQGIGLLVVDVVTNRQHDLHSELLTLLELDPDEQEPTSPRSSGPPLYAVAYHTVMDDPARLDVWNRQLRLGENLPKLPLWLSPEMAVPVDLEASHRAACEMLRIS